ncbi:MAG: murein hydrolase activator EnvC family protein [Acidimicrobiales bacterium]
MINRRVLAAAGVWAALVASLAPGRPAAAQTEEDQQRVEGKISSLRRDVREASAEETRLLRLIDASSAHERELDVRVRALDGQIGSVQRDLNQAAGRLGALRVRERETEARLEAAGRELAVSRAELARQAVAAYTGQSESSRLTGMLLRSSSMGELVSKRSYLRAVVGTQTDVIATDERLRDEVGDLRDQLEVGRRAAQTQRDVIAGQRDRLAASRRAQDAVRQEVAGEIAARERLRKQVLERKREYEAEVGVLERESAAIAEALRRRSAGDDRPRPGRLLRPTPAATVSGFGSRVHPIYGTARMHTGVDFAASMGSPIRAAAAGVVVSSGSYGGYGIATIVDHGGGLATLYAHQSATLVDAGQRVAAGQVIGKVGSTGASTGPHLHFEVRVNGDPVNPMSYL